MCAFRSIADDYGSASCYFSHVVKRRKRERKAKHVNDSVHFRPNLLSKWKAKWIVFPHELIDSNVNEWMNDEACSRRPLHENKIYPYNLAYSIRILYIDDIFSLAASRIRYTSCCMCRKGHTETVTIDLWDQSLKWNRFDSKMIHFKLLNIERARIDTVILATFFIKLLIESTV